MALSSTANVTKFQLGAWWLAARPKTLAASVAPILVGGMAAWPVMNPMIFIVSLLCAISLQITVNFANDYFDAKSGIDTPARLGPVRATASGLIAQKQMRFAIELMLLLSACLGLLLIAHGGWLFLFLGAASLLAALAYSGGPWPLASHGLGEVTVFIFFGLVAVMGSYWLHQAQWSNTVLLLAVIMALPVSAIMLVNNIRDIHTDQQAGKITLAVRLGGAHSRQLYIAMMVLPLLGIGMLQFKLGGYWWLALPMAVRLPSMIRHIRHDQGRQLNAMLASTAQWLLQFALLIVLALWLNAY